MGDYQDFVARKLGTAIPSGIQTVPSCFAQAPLFDHQSVLTRWSLRRGCAAVFADTGLGKMRIEITWAMCVHAATDKDVLILCPLAVAQQIVAEAAIFGVIVTHCREERDVRPGINVTNYDRLHKFDTDRFAGVVLDESGCIKHSSSKTFSTLVDTFRHTPYKLPASATPAPNDWTELGTHAEFLGVCTHQEMLSEYFIHDAANTQEWRLKGHAKAAFWKWVASWGAMVRRPSDLGFDDSRYILPPLNVQDHIVRSSDEIANEMGFLFPMEASTLSERRGARKASIDGRVQVAADIANTCDRPMVIWCDLNAEADALRQAIPGAVEIRGSDDSDLKEQRLIDFAGGRISKLITKASICGWGVNWQHCHDTVFVGVTDSYEAYYQAVRRFWRFGQKNQVNVHVIASEAEGHVIANIRRKETAAIEMAEQLSRETRESVQAEVLGIKRQTNTYNANSGLILPAWLQTEEMT